MDKIHSGGGKSIAVEILPLPIDSEMCYLMVSPVQLRALEDNIVARVTGAAGEVYVRKEYTEWQK